MLRTVPGTAVTRRALLSAGMGAVATGKVVQRSFTQAWKSLTFREPEGLAIQLTSSAPRLCFGFATGVSGARRTAIIYKNTLV